MFSGNGKISGRQMFRLLTFDLLGFGTLVIPATLAGFCGRDGIFCIVAGILAGLIFLKLMEGSVKVVSRRKANEALVLKPDNKVSLQMDGTLKIAPVDDYDLYRWKEGLICFKNKSFLSIMKELEEYFGTQIKVENKNVLKHSFTGKFRQSDGLDYALRVLQKDIAFVYERDDEHQIIYIR